MVLTDLDIWRTAQLVIDQHGADAPIQAAMRADALFEKGDYDGQRAWRKIIKAIAWLQEQQPATSAH